MKLKQLIITIAVFYAVIAQVNAQIIPPLSPLQSKLQAKKVVSASLGDLLDEMGEEVGLKFAVENKYLNKDGVAISELTSAIFTGTLSAGTCEQQLETIGTQVRKLEWKLDGQIIWIVDRHIGEDSPLNVKIATVDFHYPIYALGAFLHKFDSRFPNDYLWSSVGMNWGNYPIQLVLTNVSARNVFSAALEQVPASGCLMEFCEYKKSDFPKIPGQIRGFYSWHLLKDPAEVKLKKSSQSDGRGHATTLDELK